jgi:hypothetical protein
MKHRTAIAVVIFLFQSASYAEDKKTLVIPFPKADVNVKSNVFYCDATVGTGLDGREKDVMQDFPDFISSRGLGLSGTAYFAKDRLVIVVRPERRLLELYHRDEFEAGGSSQAVPYDIIDDKTDTIVATATNTLVSPPPISVITLNRKNGIATWTTVLSYDFIIHNARIDAEYLTCGVRKK